MCRLIETIRVYQGKADNLPAHEARVNRAQLSIFKRRTLPELQQLFAAVRVPDDQLYKWRIVYDRQLRLMELQPHLPPRFQRLQIIHLPDAAYAHKYEDRSFLEEAKKDLTAETEAIIVVHGRVTDSTYTNLAFETGGRWYTPDQPLLAGTRREQLLRDKKIVAAPIHQEDLKTFNKVRLFNALMTWEDCLELPIDSICNM